MKYTTKSRIAIVAGVCLIVFVASLIGLPFTYSDSTVQKISHENIEKLEESEVKMLGVIAQEKAELESKISGKLAFP